MWVVGIAVEDLATLPAICLHLDLSVVGTEKPLTDSAK